MSDLPIGWQEALASGAPLKLYSGGWVQNKEDESKFDLTGCLIFRDEQGRLHNDNAPAVVTQSRVEYWKHGKLHRDPIEDYQNIFPYDMIDIKYFPAVFGVDDPYIEYWYEGKIHRMPDACKDEAGKITFLQYGPAVIYSDRESHWYNQGELLYEKYPPHRKILAEWKYPYDEEARERYLNSDDV